MKERQYGAKRTKVKDVKNGMLLDEKVEGRETDEEEQTEE